MKKRFIKRTIALLSVLALYLIIDNMFFPTSISYNEMNQSEMISFKKNTIVIDYSMINLFLEEMNGFIDYGDNLSDIYNDIVDKYNKKNYARLYDEGKYKVLEIKYPKKEAKELFSNYMEVTGDVKVKVMFNKNWNLKNISLAKLDKKLNTEEVMRNQIVKLAQKQVGVYGKRYWSWWGAKGRMEWCCVFVSWLANETGTINKQLPKFAAVSQGIAFFKAKNAFKYAKNYTPKPGDIVFFDFPSDYLVDHVGIVEKVENGTVYTIEGNAGTDYVKRKEYPIGHSYLYAYGVPDYKNAKQN